MLILIINRQIRHCFSNFANFANFQGSKSRNFGDWQSIAKAKFSSPCLRPKSRIWRCIARNANTVCFALDFRSLCPEFMAERENWESAWAAKALFAEKIFKIQPNLLYTNLLLKSPNLFFRRRFHIFIIWSSNCDLQFVYVGN